MIRIERTPEVPATLQDQGKSARAELEAAHERGERDFTFTNKIYGANDVKETLKTMQHDKCAFCEAKITHIQYGDVEHFRPKGGWCQNDEDTLHRPGYYWLAYEWQNLLLACQLCNQRHKRNLFPLDDPAKRASSHQDDIEPEQPVFINPTLENPEQHVTFHGADPTPVNGSKRGRETIRALGLHRPELREIRAKHLERLETWKRLLEAAESQDLPTPDLVTEVGESREKLLAETRADAEYAAMARALLRS